MAHVADYARGHSGYNRVVRYIVCNNCPSADQRGFADGHARSNGCIAANRSTTLYSRVYNLPVGFSLQRAILIRCARITVVNKHDAVANKHLVFNCDALTNKSVRRDLAARSYRGVLLDLDKRADLSFRADVATVEVD